MSWTTPRTWADGELPTAALFNAQFRDNLNALANHRHGDGSGSGASSLGPINGITYLSTAAPSAPGGTWLQTFATNGTPGWVDSDGSVYGASNDTHTHGQTASTVFNAQRSNVLSAGGLGTVHFQVGTIYPGNTLGTNAWQSVGKGLNNTLSTPSKWATFTGTVGGTGARGLIIQGHAYAEAIADADDTHSLTFRIQYDKGGTGTSVAVTSSLLTFTGSSTTRGGEVYMSTYLATQTGSFRLWMEAYNTSTSLKAQVSGVYLAAHPMANNTFTTAKG